jgi:DNA-binding MarR family transcriptional regulator
VAVNTLGAQLGLSSGAVTALVDRLEHHELVQRNRDPRDRRGVIVTLTPKAHGFGAQHLIPLAQAIQKATAELGDPELAAVEHFLELLLDAHQTPASPHIDPAPAASSSIGR